MEYLPSYTDDLYEGLYLEHHGVLGQKWGVRRYQNEDGTRTTEGKRREKLGLFEKTPSKLKINDTDSAITKRVKNDFSKLSNDDFKRKYSTSKRTFAKRVMKSDSGDPYKDTATKVKNSNSNLRKRMLDKSIDKEAKQMTSVHLAEKTEAYASSQSTGKRVAKNLLLGKAGAQAYDMARSAGVSRGRAAVATVLAGSTNTKNAADMYYQQSSAGQRYTANTKKAYDI